MEAFGGFETPLHYRGSRLLGLSSFISDLCTRLRIRAILRSWTSALRRSANFGLMGSEKVAVAPKSSTLLYRRMRRGSSSGTITLEC